MIKLISHHDGFIHFQFPFNPEILAEVRSIPNRHYVAKDKQWIVPVTSLTNETIDKINSLKEYFEFKITDEVASIILNRQKTNANFKYLADLNDYENSDLDIELAKGVNLRGYQKAGIKYLIESKNCVLGYEMRLGKSITAGAAIKHLNAFPLIILTTASTKIHWKQEFESKLLISGAHIINGKTPYELPESKIYILNHAIVSYHKDNLLKLNAKSIIIDEIHNFGSKGSSRTKATIEITKQVPIKYGLTGTLFRNNIKELATILEVVGVMPRIASDSFSFLHSYTHAEHNGYGWTFKGGKNLVELNNRLVTSGSYLRKTQADVMKELPPVQVTVLPVTITNRKEYKSIEEGVTSTVTKVNDNLLLFNEFLEQTSLEGRRLGLAKKQFNEDKRELINQVLKQITLLKECVGRGKVESAIEWLDTFLNETNEKVVVFAHHKTVQAELIKHFGNRACSILAEYNSEKRELERNKFNTSNDKRVIICSLMAASEGIDLSSANTVLHTEYWWNPAIMDQASARIKRVGKTDPLNIYYLSAIDSIDQYSEKIISEKSILNKAVDGQEPEELNFFNYFSTSVLSK